MDSSVASLNPVLNVMKNTGPKINVIKLVHQKDHYQTAWIIVTVLQIVLWSTMEEIHLIIVIFEPARYLYLSLKE